MVNFLHSSSLELIGVKAGFRVDINSNVLLSTVDAKMNLYK